MRRLTAAIAAAVLTAGLLLTPASAATAQVPRKCVLVSQVVSGELPGVWTVYEQTWRCVPPGPWIDIRYALVVH